MVRVSVFVVRVACQGWLHITVGAVIFGFVNFNVYVDDATAEKLRRLARKTRASRNSLVRSAIAAYLERAASSWPAIVTGYEGDESVRPFEAARDELVAPVDDPFAPARNLGARRKKRS